MGRFWIPKSVEKTCQDFYRPAKAAKSRQAEPGRPLRWCPHGRVSVGQFQPERTGFQALISPSAGAYPADRERCPDAAGYSCWSGRLAPCCGAALGLHVVDRRGAHVEELGGLDLAQGGVLLERPQHDVPVKIPLATNRRRERRDHRGHLVFGKRSFFSDPSPGDQGLTLVPEGGSSHPHPHPDAVRRPWAATAGSQVLWGTAATASARPGPPVGTVPAHTETNWIPYGRVCALLRKRHLVLGPRTSACTPKAAFRSTSGTCQNLPFPRVWPYVSNCLPPRREGTSTQAHKRAPPPATATTQPSGHGVPSAKVPTSAEPTIPAP